MDKYPASIKLDEVDGLLACVNKYHYEYKHTLDNPSDGIWKEIKVAVHLVIDKLKVITFDNLFKTKIQSFKELHEEA